MTAPGACLRALAVAAAASAIVGAQEAPPMPAPPTRFERVLWISAPEGAAVAAQHGFTAVQNGRGADPAPAIGKGLGFYLDQPIGKGLLELRDDAWAPVRAAYEARRDPAALVRPTCFAAPGVLDAAVAAVAAEVARARGPSLRFVALADEPSATRHDAPLDTCRCAHCLAAFRAFARKRYGSLDAANAALGTQFATFEQLAPPTVDQIRRRELGDAELPADLRPFGAWLDFVDEQYADAIRRLAAAAHAAAPGVPVGLTGLSAPAAFGGNDFARWLPSLTLVEPYALGGAVELAWSLAPAGAHHYASIAPPNEAALGGASLAHWAQAAFAALACDGAHGAVAWNDRTVAGADGALTPFGAAVVAAQSALGPTLDACAGASQVLASVWLVESQAAVRAWWMLDSAGDGMTWPRRLASHERTHSTSQAARVGWVRLLQDLGVEPRFVAEATLAESLLRERPRVLVLPATIALADRTAQAVRAYVHAGGTALADHSTGLYDEQLLRRGSGALDALFGVSARSRRWDALLVREGQPVARGRGLPLAEGGLAGAMGEKREGGMAHLEHTLGRGRAVYLNAPVAGYGAWRLDIAAIETAFDLRRRVRGVLQRAGVEPPCEVRGDGLPTCIRRTRLRLRDGRDVLTVRVNALDAPAVLRELARDGARAVRLELPTPRRLFRLDGSAIGDGPATRFDLRLDPWSGLFVEVRP
ncbi:MAG: hypothetical protein FJ301_00935 [Planctomycetes bacterium]|nr:hypothetical protein [Planctomycetota bacterium]